MKPLKIFHKSFNRLMKHEGGYVNHPNDPGGETMYGVTKRVARAHGYKGNMRNLPLSTAMAIAKKSYWDAVRGDDLNPMIASQLFDAAYNHGTRNAVKFLQRAINVNDDGIIGPLTINATVKMAPEAVVMLFNAERIDFYTRLRTWSVFGKGWARRVSGNLRAVAMEL